LVLSLALLAHLAPQISSDEALAVFTARSGFNLPYRLYLPDRAQGTTDQAEVGDWSVGDVRQDAAVSDVLPMLLCLSESSPGVTARSADLSSIVTILERHQTSAIVLLVYLSAGCVPDVLLSGGPRDLSGPERTPEAVVAVIQLLDEVLERQPVDRLRVYLAGYGLGGTASWELVARFPGRFAAMVPVAAGGDPRLARRLIDVPTWVFHGAIDRRPVSLSRAMVSAIWAAGGHRIRYTEYRRRRGATWELAMEDQAVVRWLFSQTLSPR
jgi:predicted peptidase